MGIYMIMSIDQHQYHFLLLVIKQCTLLVNIIQFLIHVDQLSSLSSVAALFHS
jgi:hypothetical protein